MYTLGREICIEHRLENHLPGRIGSSSFSVICVSEVVDLRTMETYTGITWPVLPFGGLSR